MSDWIHAIILGLIEGLTEFIPVSSTGMLLLAKQAMGLTDPFWDTFCVLIQLGAIMAVVVLYFRRLWSIAVMVPTLQFQVPATKSGRPGEWDGPPGNLAHSSAVAPRLATIRSQAVRHRLSPPRFHRGPRE